MQMFNGKYSFGLKILVKIVVCGQHFFADFCLHKGVIELAKLIGSHVSHESLARRDNKYKINFENTFPKIENNFPFRCEKCSAWVMNERKIMLK